MIGNVTGRVAYVNDNGVGSSGGVVWRKESEQGRVWSSIEVSWAEVGWAEVGSVKGSERVSQWASERVDAWECVRLCRESQSVIAFTCVSPKFSAKLILVVHHVLFEWACRTVLELVSLKVLETQVDVLKCLEHDTFWNILAFLTSDFLPATTSSQRRCACTICAGLVEAKREIWAIWTYHNNP